MHCGQPTWATARVGGHRRAARGRIAMAVGAPIAALTAEIGALLAGDPYEEFWITNVTA